MKKTITLLLLTSLFLLPFHTVDAWNCFRNEEGASQANTIHAQTPTDTQTSGPKWRKKLSSETGIILNSTPVITAEHIFVVSKNTLYKMDKEGNILSTLSLAASMNSICHMALHENKLFLPLSGGVMQCVDSETMSSLWTSEAFGNQSLTSVYYQNGLVYAGTTNAKGTEGTYYCLSEADGHTVWTYHNGETPCGFYWSGAVSVETPSSECLLFGGDNGILVSHSLTDDTTYDTFRLSEITGSEGKIRAGITYDADTNAYYTTSNNGYLYKIIINENRQFESVTPVFLGDTAPSTVNCTSTPTIYNGRIYVCCYYGTSGRISVVDAVSMKTIYYATNENIHDIKSSPLVSTGYATKENDNKVVVYFTQNASPGGIYYIEDHASATSAQIKTLYEPKNDPQFCLSSIAADTDGTLYYSNDSGTFFAVHEGYAGNDILVTEPPENTNLPPVSSESPALSQSPFPSGTPAPPVKTSEKATTSSNIKPKKPTKIKVSYKRKSKKTYKVTFSWKKGKYAKKTLLKIRGKKIKPLSGSKKTMVLKKGTYIIRFYGYNSSSCKSAAAKMRLKLK